MPQMSPMMWTTVLITMTMMVMMISSMNFFESTKMKINSMKKKKNYMSWKW